MMRLFLLDIESFFISSSFWFMPLHKSFCKIYSIKNERLSP